MRIIAGKYKGKKLKEFNILTTRPTLDRVKESMFDLIQFNLKDAVVLDLFSGTGALGIESISRGAKHTIFVDNNIKSISLIKENLKDIIGSYEIINSDYLDYLKSVNSKFDIIFLDPPFDSDFGLIAIDYIVNKNLLNDNGIIIFETDNEKKLNLEYSNFSIDKRKYGTVAVYKIEKIM